MIKTSDEGTSYCTQCEVYAREIDRLRKDKDEWELLCKGWMATAEKREEEIDRLKALAIKTDEDLAKEICENNRLKTELEQLKWAVKVNDDEGKQYDESLRKDRDLWKYRAESEKGANDLHVV